MSTNISFSVTASGTLPLFYQWESGSTLMVDGARITGSVSTGYTSPTGYSSSLIINSVQYSDTGSYRVMVGNIIGNDTSSYATLYFTSIIYPPLIIFHPVDQTTYEGFTASFSVTAVGTATLQYQWISGSTNLVDGVRITGSNSASLRINNVQYTDTGSYKVLVSNLGGSAYSNTASLHVTDNTVTSSWTEGTASMGIGFLYGSLSDVDAFDEPTPPNLAVGFYSGSLMTTILPLTMSSETMSIGLADRELQGRAAYSLGFYSGSLMTTITEISASTDSSSFDVGFEGGYLFSSTVLRSGSKESSSFNVGFGGGYLETKITTSAQIEYVFSMSVGFWTGSIVEFGP